MWRPTHGRLRNEMDLLLVDTPDVACLPGSQVPAVGPLTRQQAAVDGFYRQFGGLRSVLSDLANGDGPDLSPISPACRLAPPCRARTDDFLAVVRAVTDDESAHLVLLGLMSNDTCVAASGGHCLRPDHDHCLALASSSLSAPGPGSDAGGDSSASAPGPSSTPLPRLGVSGIVGGGAAGGIVSPGLLQDAFIDDLLPWAATSPSSDAESDDSSISAIATAFRHLFTEPNDIPAAEAALHVDIPAGREMWPRGATSSPVEGLPGIVSPVPGSASNEPLLEEAAGVDLPDFPDNGGVGFDPVVAALAVQRDAVVAPVLASRFGFTLGVPGGSVEDALHKLLFCPLCDDLMYPIYMQCDNSHHLCPRCVGKVQVCPYCRECRPYWRNRGLEDFVATMTHPCRYVQDGCTIRLEADEWYLHSDSCEFRPADLPDAEVEAINRRARDA